MSGLMLPPNPCLLAIILITKTRDGTNEIFHYPAHPGQSRSHRRSSSAASGHGGAGRESDASSSSSSADDDDVTDLEPVRSHVDGPGGGGGGSGGGGSGNAGGDNNNDANGSRPPHHRRRHQQDGAANGVSADDSGATSPEKAGGAHTWPAAVGQQRHGGSGGGGDGLLGLPDGFHHFLCPPSSFNRHRFEMAIDRLVFLGWPAYARDDGSWRRARPDRSSSRRSRRRSSRKKRAAAAAMRPPRPPSSAATKNLDQLRRQSVQADALQQQQQQQDGTASEAESGLDASKGEESESVSGFEAGYGHRESDASSAKEALNMFNVVFVLNPSPLEYQQRVDQMYKYVVKRFSKALRWEQVKSDFVLRESEKLRGLRSKHSSMDSVLKHSALARAIADLYDGISASKIAHVELTPRTSFSLQLPMPSSISILPSLTEPQLPGVWLTTANSVADASPTDINIDHASSRLANNFALLLLGNAQTIIAEISASQSPLAPAMANYLRHTQPTRSFLQISQSSGIPLAEIHSLASHLIYWRRAKAVPPLHHRDIYITSPNADMKKLKSAASHFAKQFPALPGLPKMLGLLGAGPRPYSTFIPSKDHKQAYMDILAWLIRGGWVTQLRTFGWVRVSAEVRERAKERLREEEKDRRAGKGRRPKRLSDESKVSSARSSGDEDEDDRSSQDDESDAASTSTSTASAAAGEPDLPAGYLTPMQSSIHTNVSADSMSTARTTIPVSRSQNLELDSEDSGPVLIVSPARASGIESHYLAAITGQMEEEDGKEVREAWESCLKYFNGEHALEKIAVREGWKRKKVEALRARWRSRGVLLEVRHW